MRLGMPTNTCLDSNWRSLHLKIESWAWDFKYISLSTVPKYWFLRMIPKNIVVVYLLKMPSTSCSGMSSGSVWPITTLVKYVQHLAAFFTLYPPGKNSQGRVWLMFVDFMNTWLLNLIQDWMFLNFLCIINFCNIIQCEIELRDQK